MKRVSNNKIIDKTRDAKFLTLLAVFILLYFNGKTLFGQEYDSINEKLTEMDQYEKYANEKIQFLPSRLKTAEINTLRLDSIVDEIDNGFYSEYSIEYFKYNENDQYLESSEKFFYNSAGKIKNEKERSTYNRDGQVETVLRIRTISIEGYPDTTITVHREHNKYDAGKLIEKDFYSLGTYHYGVNNNDRIYLSTIDSVSYTNKYRYNDSGKLEYSNEFKLYSTNSTWGRPVESFYYYYPNGDLKYIYTFPELYKYRYERAGDIFIKSENATYFETEITADAMDTITQWYYVIADEMKMDSNGRIVSLRNTMESSYLPNIRYQFKAEFEYNEANQLLHARYYSYGDVEDSASYYEATRIDNTYDDEGNILVYHKTFYDARTVQWLNREKRTYYYSSAKSAETFDDNESIAIRLFPNPTQNELNISINDGTYSIISFTGKAVATNKLITKNIDVSNLKAGVYFIQLNDGNKVETLRFVKE